MQHEQPQIINSERYQELRSAIFGMEIASLLPEHAQMFSAENDACFTQFLDTLPFALKDRANEAVAGDKQAILVMSDAYHEFRDLMESELAAKDPDAYDAFIEAVAAGDTTSASEIVTDFHQSKALSEQGIIDDELDTQFI